MLAVLQMLSIVLGTPQEEWYSTAAGCVTFATVMLGTAVLVAFFVHADDKSGNWLPKIIIMLGLTCSIMCVLLLPLDVNNRTGGLLPMPLLWIIFMTIIAFLAVVAVPWAFLWYTAEEDSGCCSKCWRVTKWQFWLIVIFGTALAVMYIMLGVAEVPVEELSASYDAGALTDPVAGACGDCPEPKDTVKEVNVSFIVYMIGIMAMFGWIFLVMFGGVGLVSFPLDLVYGYINRPQKIDIDLFARGRQSCKERAAKLIEFGKTFEAETTGRSQSRKQKNMFQKFKQASLQLEADWTKLKIAYKGPFSPMKYYSMLGIGIAGAFLSTLWIVHIILYIVVKPPASPFLNLAFVMIEKAFPLVTIALYCTFAFWFLLAVVAGNIKIGNACTCFPLHSLVLGKTYVDSFLFNTLLIMSTSIAIISFCTTAFRVYARLTAADMIFNVQIRNLKGINLIWQGFEYALFSIIFLTGLFFYICRKKKDAQDELAADLEEMVQGGGKDRSSGCTIL